MIPGEISLPLRVKRLKKVKNLNYHHHRKRRHMDFLTIATNITFVILSATLILAFYRILKGPSLPDRVIAIDILAYVVIGFIATFCVAVNQPIYLDIALVLALIAFLSTIAFARYISNRQQESK